MAKITLNDPNSGFNSASQLTENNETVEDHLNNKVLYRDNPSGEANAMQNDLDMNSNRILNLPSATQNSEPITYGQWTGGTQTVEFTGYLNETFTATAGQTAFTLANAYTLGIGAIRAYINGVYQAPSAYTETDANTITFSEGLEAGDQAAFVISSFDAAAATGANNITYTPSGASAVASNVQTKLRERVSVKDFGAVGDGVTDDTTALQAALDSNQIVYVPPGKYRTTSNLVVDPARNRGCGLVGLVEPSIYPETQQSGGPAWSGTQECQIFYDGSSGATTAVIAISSEAVGTEPASTFDTTVWGFLLQNITLNGNDKAQYGFYAARLQNPDVQNVIARQCEGDGFYINGTYSGSFRNITARLNGGRGISIGAAGEDLAWATNNKCNGVRFYDLWAYANGGDKAFDESSAPRAGCGIYFRPHRGCTIYGATSELNDGVGIVFAPTSSSNVLRDVYTELNSDYEVGGTDAIDDGRATLSYGIRFEGITGGVSYGNKVDSAFLASEELWIQGTEPSSTRPESAPEFADILGGSGITAAWANYKLVNCAEELHASITGSSPTAGFHVPAGVLFDRTGTSLANYEEGTWTPAIEGSSVAGTAWGYTVATGTYTRIGRTVFVSATVVLSAIGSGASGSVTITGLPFTLLNSNGNRPVAAVSSANMTTAVVSMEVTPVINTTTALLRHRTAAATSGTQTQISDLSATTDLRFGFTYQV